MIITGTECVLSNKVIFDANVKQNRQKKTVKKTTITK